MTISQALTRARQMLAAGKSDNPSLESEALLRHYLGKDRAYIHREPHTELDEKTGADFFRGIERLLQGEPLAYITHSREFFGLDFNVDSRALVPRPETELLVEEAIILSRGRRFSLIADIGTGSGAIAVSLAKSLLEDQNAGSKGTGAGPPEIKHPADLKIYATDISTQALEVARTNCLKHNVQGPVTLLQGDLLEPLPEAVDLILANLPYVRTEDLEKMPFALYEPRNALDGGESGLETIDRFFQGLPAKLRAGGCILMEIGLGQAQYVTSLLHKRLPSAVIEVIPDLAGIQRVVKAEQPV
ncbi:MAG: peptide chain release factor N(5)-glutamine methyltransferase [Dehalococcoidales bacterium]|nr:peptide chain release factor N(5)-glutamine methyltransferase [Dehalococcoidales bacterium]